MGSNLSRNSVVGSRSYLKSDDQDAELNAVVVCRVGKGDLICVYSLSGEGSAFNLLLCEYTKNGGFQLKHYGVIGSNDV